MSQLPSRRVAVGLLALVLANLALNSGLSLALNIATRLCGPGWPGTWGVLLVALALVAVAVSIGHTLLLAVWIGFSQERWDAQFGLPAITLACASALSHLAAGGDALGAAAVALLLQIVLWIMVVPLLPIRRLRGWRLTKDQSAVSAKRMRFYVSDFLIWVVTLSLALGLTRFFIAAHAVPGPGPISRNERLEAIAILMLLLVPLLWLVMQAALAPRGWRHSWLYFAGIPAYLFVATAIAVRLFYGIVYDAFWMPRPGWMMLPYCALFGLAFFGLPSLVLSLNGLYLRRLGYRLIRPRWQESSDSVPPAVLAAATPAAE